MSVAIRTGEHLGYSPKNNETVACILAILLHVPVLLNVQMNGQSLLNLSCDCEHIVSLLLNRLFKCGVIFGLLHPLLSQVEDRVQNHERLLALLEI